MSCDCVCFWLGNGPARSLRQLPCLSLLVFGEDIRHGDLQNLVRLGITPTLFAHDSPTSYDPDPEMEAVTEGASNLADQDVNIWSEPSTIVTSSSMAQANYLNMHASFAFGGGGAPKNLIFETIHHHHSHAAAAAVPAASTSSLGSISAILNGEEGTDSENSTQTHIVKAATFNQLILWLLSTESDSHFRHVFFGTLHSFASPQQFIAKIEQRYTTPSGLPKLDQLELFSIANTMTHWVSTYGHEFSHRTYSLLSKFVENTFIRDGHHHIAESLQNVIARAFLNRQSRRAPPSIRAQEMLNTPDTASILSSTGSAGGLNTTQTNSAHSSSLPTAVTPLSTVLASADTSSTSPHSSFNDFRRPLQGFPEPKIPKTIFELSLSLDDVDEEEIARQFTCLDSETFMRVKTQELIKNAWLKNRGRKAKRVVLLLNAGNALSKWVQDSISNATGSMAMNGSSSGGSSPLGLFGMPGSHPNASSSMSGPLGSASGLAGAASVGASGGMGGASASGSGSSSASNSSSAAASGVSSAGSSMSGADGSNSANLMGGGNALDANGGDFYDGDSNAHFEKSSCISSVLTQKANPQLQHHSLSSQVTYENTKRIVKTISKWIRIAEHLRTLNNFHSLLAIWVALRSRYVNSAFWLLKKDFPKSILDVRFETRHPGTLSVSSTPTLPLISYRAYQSLCLTFKRKSNPIAFLPLIHDNR